MKITREQFYAGLLTSTWSREPSYRNTFLSIEEALKKVGATNFEYWRNDDGTNKFHLALSCKLSGHEIGVFKPTKALSTTNSGHTYDNHLTLTIDKKIKGEYDTPDSILYALKQYKIIKSSTRLIMNKWIEQTTELLSPYDRDNIVRYFTSVGSVPTITQFRAWMLQHGKEVGYAVLIKEYPDLCEAVQEKLYQKDDGVYAKVKSSVESEFVQYLQDEGESQHDADSEFCPFQLATGVLVELEHTDSFDAAKEIAKDHLKEDAEYYGRFFFPGEAQDRIEDLKIEDFEPSEVTQSINWKEAITKYALKSGVLHDGDLHLSIGRVKGCYHLNMLDSGVIITSDADNFSLLTNGEAYFTNEQFHRIFGDEITSRVVYTVPLSLPIHSNIEKEQPIFSYTGHDREKSSTQYVLHCDFDDSWKETFYFDSLEEAQEWEDRYTPAVQGICTTKIYPIKEFKGKLTNHYVPGNKLQQILQKYLPEHSSDNLVKFWELADNKSCYLGQVVLSEDKQSYCPNRPCLADCLAADALNEIAVGNPAGDIYTASVESLLKGIPCETSEVEVEFGSDVADCLKGISIGCLDECIENAPVEIPLEVTSLVLSSKEPDVLDINYVVDSIEDMGFEVLRDNETMYRVLPDKEREIDLYINNGKLVHVQAYKNKALRYDEHNPNEGFFEKALCKITSNRRVNSSIEYLLDDDEINYIRQNEDGTTSWLQEDVVRNELKSFINKGHNVLIDGLYYTNPVSLPLSFYEARVTFKSK